MKFCISYCEFPAPAELINLRFISLIISCISRVFKKILKYFIGTATSTSSVLPAIEFLLVIVSLKLNDSESVIVVFDSSLQYLDKLPEVLEQISLYSIKLAIY